jgi:hypothetical protein
LRRLAILVAVTAAALTATPSPAIAGVAPFRIHASMTCSDGVALDVTLENPGKRTVELFDVHIRLTPVRPGRANDIGVEAFVLLIPEASVLSPGETANFGIALPGYDLSGRRLLVDVAVFLIGRHRPATARITGPGCPAEG